MATTAGGAGTLQAQIVELFKTSPKKLYTKFDIMEQFDIEERPAENGLYNAFRLGKIMRHIDKCGETGVWRFALSVPESKADVYVKNEAKSASMTKGAKRKKGKSYSSREIRTAFAQAMNTLAQLEDMVSTVVDLAEDTEKKMLKIENLLR